jgi:hypothetical protein
VLIKNNMLKTIMIIAAITGPKSIVKSPTKVTKK